MANTKIVPIGMNTPVDAAITTTGAGAAFSFQMHASTGDFSALFLASGTLTTLSADLQVSTDGGTTWFTVSTAVLTAAAPAKIVTPVICGALYRFNYTTASGSINVFVVSN